MICKNPNLSL